MSFQKLDKAKDKNFWSVRVGSDIRLIVHKTASSLLLCYVHHYDKACRWSRPCPSRCSLRRHLLYVACTRARDRLLVTSVEPSSEFLEDLMGTN